jgi:multiple sugar transport system substrate-binding protein
MKRRNLFGLFMVLVFVLSILLTACSGTTQKTPAPQPATPPAATTEDPTQIKADITVWGWTPWDKAFEAVMAGFNKKYPNIKVKVELMSNEDAHNKLLAALAAGDGAPDVAGIEINQIANFGTKGGLVNLLEAPYNAGSYQKDMVPYKWTQATTPDGRLIAFPWDIGPATLFYRRDVFEKAGLPSDPDQVAALLKDWNGFVDAGKKLKDKGIFIAPNAGDIFGIYFSKHDIFDDQWNVAVDSARGVKALNAAKAVRDAGLDAKLTAWTPEWQAALADGKVATVIGGAWLGGFLKTWVDTNGSGRWGVVPIPEDPAQNWGGSFLAIPEQSKNKLAAWKFIEYTMATKEAQNAFFKAVDFFPAYMPAWNDPMYDEKDPYFKDQQTKKLWVDITKKIGPLVVTPMDPVAESILNQTVAQCLEEKTDSKACLAAAKKEIESKTAQDKKLALQLKNKGKK